MATAVQKRLERLGSPSEKSHLPSPHSRAAWLSSRRATFSQEQASEGHITVVGGTRDTSEATEAQKVLGWYSKLLKCSMKRRPHRSIPLRMMSDKCQGPHKLQSFGLDVPWRVAMVWASAVASSMDLAKACQGTQKPEGDIFRQVRSAITIQGRIPATQKHSKEGQGELLVWHVAWEEEIWLGEEVWLGGSPKNPEIEKPKGWICPPPQAWGSPSCFRQNQGEMGRAKESGVLR